MRNLTTPARAQFEYAKTEVEFDRVLDAVRAALASAPDLNISTPSPSFGPPPKATNDNEPAWPLIQSPEGWYAD
ncbi:MAG: hypothetical protein E6G85_01935 [Alphaproteobacteria bacterium]|nr:MAG: hypothetical protein E6G85_01935 [Alphaproteobacteria bacterium]